ncbi:unnamed protein product [Mytilus edulis]|uniref:BACK domain-containing protein n=1 Tax=Mytilus edulis TaxID=6550 RepID=A0A8S3U378_MYTED|nr:unnamed protein product [Mytilus edulis]
MQEVLYIAETYMLSTMKDECLNQLLSSIETSNAHVVFDVASKFHLEHLKSKSLEYIQKNAEEYFTEPNAIQMSRDCIEAILELDSISCSETNIFRFFIKWAGHQCEAAGKTASGENMREITGSLLNLIRFPVINRSYFAHQIPSGFLTSEEVISVFSSHHGSKNEYFNESNRNSKRNLNVFRPSYTYHLSTDSLNKKIKLK